MLRLPVFLVGLLVVLGCQGGGKAEPGGSTDPLDTGAPDDTGDTDDSGDTADASDTADTDDTADTGAAGSNEAPVSDAGTDQTVILGDTVSLDGSDSHDPDGDSLTWTWSVAEAPDDSSLVSGDIDDRYAEVTSVVPDVVGEYTIKLKVDDGSDSDADKVTITVEGGTDPANTAPVADAGGDQSVSLGDTVSLDGSESYDEDGDVLTYTWSVVETPDDSALVSGDIDDRYSEVTSVVPDVAGDYTMRLKVEDSADSDADKVTVTVEEDSDPGDTGSTASDRDGDYTGELIIDASYIFSDTCEGDVELSIVDGEIVGEGVCEFGGAFSDVGEVSGDITGTVDDPDADGEIAIDVDGTTYDWSGGFDGDTLTGSFSGTFYYDHDTYGEMEIDFTGSFEVDPE